MSLKDNYRFIVKGHWRTGPDGRRHWVESYVRGPENAPIICKEPPPPFYKDGITPTTDVNNRQVFLVEGHWRKGLDGQMVWMEPGVLDPEQHAKDVAEFMRQQQEEQEE